MKLSHIKKLTNKTILYDANALREYCRLQVAGKTDEEMHIIYLDGELRVVEHEVHSQGSIESTNIYINKILSKALSKRVKSVVMLHNHPVSENIFSSQDIIITQKLEDTLNNCGLTLYDHYVVVSGVLYSIREKGYLNKSVFHNE